MIDEHSRGPRRLRLLTCLLGLGLGLFAASAIAFDPAIEGKNFAKTSERYQYIVGTPQFQARLQQQNVDDNAELAAIGAAEAAEGATSPATSASNTSRSAPATSLLRLGAQRLRDLQAGRPSPPTPVPSCSRPA